ncbi:MAG TPA: endopeptidase La, partial [Polyangiaceae bacterium]|nr:endopeptidase La [Polyangiaceae bacterium]
QITFLATANYKHQIPEALKDRMEMIEVPGYTRTEKRSIAQKFLVPKQLKEHGLEDGQLTFEDAGIETIIDYYTHEAGVRGVEREIASVCREATVRLAEGQSVQGERVDREHVERVLGTHKHDPEVADRRFAPGAATGLTVTGAGGDLLVIEATRMPGKGHVHVTGSMRNVMKEAAATAVSYVRSRADRLMLDPEWLKSIDLHVHVPRGASAQDAASAGLPMFVAVASLLLGAEARPDVAITGEITLRGSILPVTGIKAKLLAAHRAGIAAVVMPKRNERDLDEIPAETLADIKILLVSRIEEVLPLVLAEPDPGKRDRSVPPASGEARP